MARRLVILGAGGFAREVRWLAREIAEAGTDYDFVGFVVSDMRWKPDRGTEILGDFDWLRAHRGQFDALALGVGDPELRLAMVEQLRPDFDDSWWPSLIHPTVRMDEGSCRVGCGVLLCAGVLATVNVTFQPFCMVNLSCTIGHEARIGRGSVLNPGVDLAGGVEVGDACLLGSGATVLGGLEIGKSATVGSGAVVTRSVAAGETVVGVPARPIRRA